MSFLLPSPCAAAARAGRVPTLSPEALHPALWLAHQLSRSVERPLASGFRALDAQLPGGGWPRRTLSELLLPHAGVGEMRLLAPALVVVQRERRLVMLFDPPAGLCAGSLAQIGLDVEQLLVIHTRCGSETAHRPAGAGDPLWALEQALKSGHVGAVLAWLPPRLRPERLRRLQLAAQVHDGPAFVLRELAAAARPSPAALRLRLRAGGADMLSVRLLKRRGPPLEAALQLALPPILSATARQRAAAGVHPPLPSLQQATFVDLAAQQASSVDLAALT